MGWFLFFYNMGRHFIKKKRNLPPYLIRSSHLLECTECCGRTRSLLETYRQHAGLGQSCGRHRLLVHDWAAGRRRARHDFAGRADHPDWSRDVGWRLRCCPRIGRPTGQARRHPPFGLPKLLLSFHMDSLVLFVPFSGAVSLSLSFFRLFWYCIIKFFDMCVLFSVQHLLFFCINGIVAALQYNDRTNTRSLIIRSIQFFDGKMAWLDVKFMITYNLLDTFPHLVTKETTFYNTRKWFKLKIIHRLSNYLIDSIYL